MKILDIKIEIKNISENELKELYNIVFSIFNNTMINLITK